MVIPFLNLMEKNMKERWYLQTKKADFNEISRKFNISPILARLIRNRDVVGDETLETIFLPILKD